MVGSVFWRCFFSVLCDVFSKSKNSHKFVDFSLDLVFARWWGVLYTYENIGTLCMFPEHMSLAWCGLFGRINTYFMMFFRHVFSCIFMYFPLKTGWSGVNAVAQCFLQVHLASDSWQVTVLRHAY